MSQHEFLIGSDFIGSRNFRGKGGSLFFDPDDEEVSEVLQINVLDEKDIVEIDLSHVESEDAKRQITLMIKDYEHYKIKQRRRR